MKIQTLFTLVLVNLVFALFSTACRDASRSVAHYRTLEKKADNSDVYWSKPATRAFAVGNEPDILTDDKKTTLAAQTLKNFSDSQNINSLELKEFFATIALRQAGELAWAESSPVYITLFTECAKNQLKFFCTLTELQLIAGRTIRLLERDIDSGSKKTLLELLKEVRKGYVLELVRHDLKPATKLQNVSFETKHVLEPETVAKMLRQLALIDAKLGLAETEAIWNAHLACYYASTNDPRDFFEAHRLFLQVGLEQQARHLSFTIGQNLARAYCQGVRNFDSEGYTRSPLNEYDKVKALEYFAAAGFSGESATKLLAEKAKSAVDDFEDKAMRQDGKPAIDPKKLALLKELASKAKQD